MKYGKVYSLNGKIYFQSFTSIYIYDFNSVVKVKAPYTMLFLHQVNESFIAQIIDSGLFWFENEKFLYIENSQFFADKKVHSIIPYEKNKWLICTDNEGLFIYDGNRFELFYSETTEFLIRNTCNAAIQLNDSVYAFGSILNGLIVSDIRGKIIGWYNTENGLQNNTVLSLFKDSNQGLWIGLDNGVNYLSITSPFTHYKSSSGTLGTIYALLREDDFLYIGTNHGLFKAEIKKLGQTFQFTNLKLIADSYGQVWTLEKFDNQILCGHNEGTFLVKGDRLEKISDITGGWSYVSFGNYILGGTYTGIIILEKNSLGEWRFKRKIENFHEPIRHLEVDYLGFVWASHHQKGLFKIELSDDLSLVSAVDYKNVSYNIKVSKINNRVVFSSSENIYTYDIVRDQIVPLEPLVSNLADFKAANQISHYQKNEYWFIKDGKVGLFEIGLDFSARKKCEIVLESINLPQRKLPIVYMDDWTLLIPNPQNFDIYNLNMHSERVVANLNIERILFFGNNKSNTYFGNFERMVTSSNVNNITVYFSDPSSFEFASKSYYYRIIELDSTWQKANSNHFTYLGLNDGHYSVEIQRNDGITIRTAFFVRKPWYYTFPAFMLYIIALLLIGWLLMNFFRYRINRRKELVEMGAKQSNLENELDQKSHELMLTIRYLINKNEILNELQKEINEIKLNSSKYPVKNLKSMERIIIDGLDTQTEDWKNAMQSLKLSQQGFFKNLLDHFPELTTNDLRLCSYLRMNFSTKEIARLLNNSTRAVEISRYRLRKKMKLNHDVNLTEFLMSEMFSESFKNS
jgi:hypothetical protein